MFKRTFFGIIAALYGIAVIAFCYTPALAISLALISATACYEINKCVKVKNKPIFVISVIFSGLVPLYYEYADDLAKLIGFKIPPVALVIIYVILLMGLMLIDYENTKFEDVSAVIVASVFSSYVLASFITLRDVYITYPNLYDRPYGRFFILYALFAAWLSDTFAYFTGRFLGKHKLSPKISPKKTVEGAIGGAVGCVISCLILFAVYDKNYFTVHSFSYLGIILLSLALSAISICGDLSASVLKRNFGVKDFGNVIPGHGGVMDRFDSALFVIAALDAFIFISGSIIK